MAYSDSIHFSEQFSYKTHFIPSYSLEDMNYSRLHTCRNFLKNRERCETFLTQRKIALETDGQDTEADGELTGQRLLCWHRWLLTKGAQLSALQRNK
jgi:hypothetical protein